MPQTSDDMKKTFHLPLVPGTTCGEELLRRNYHKQQVWGSAKEKAVRSEPVPIDYTATLGVSRSINGANASLTKYQGSGYNYAQGTSGASPNGSLPGVRNKEQPISHSMNALQQSAEAPPDLNRRVLRFFGYFREPVHESGVERERVRKITIQFFLEDGTMSVLEPRQDNSGIPQGNLVRRHTIPKPDGSGPITFDMLAIGETITFYGRTYFLVDCDQFTREFLASIGADAPEPLPYPDDAHTLLRSRPAKVNDVPSIAAAADSAVKLSTAQIKASMQFFKNDRDVLRLHAVWDDSKMLYGGIHHFNMYYFLADDTIEVVEQNEVNSGRDPFPSYIRRQKMMKPQRGTNKFVNMTSSLTFKGKDESNEIYTDADLWIGATLHLFGREFLITDYDQHTRDHLRHKFGITDYNPITSNFVPKPKPKVVRQPPPHNGFGDEEDSLASWNKLDIKPPRKDGTKFAKFGNNVIKYSLKLDNNSPVDEVRRFVLSCFLCDDTIAIFEPVQRNSGIVGGKFLQRQKIKNPQTGKYFVASDFHVGGRTVINGFPFIVLATDERSMSYMEQHSSNFPQCNINAIAHKIEAMLMSKQCGLAEAFHRADADGSGHLDYKEFVSMVQDLGLGDDLSEQEILTVLRYFDRNGDGYITYDEFISRMLPEGSTIANDDRDWREIHEKMTNAEHDSLSTKDKVDRQKEKVENTTAAYAARAFLEQYQQRRTLFLQEFKFICDYSRDEKISEREFRMCCTDKLKLDLTPVQLDALAAKLFPPGARRITYDEFIRLINGNPTRDYNLVSLRDRR